MGGFLTYVKAQRFQLLAYLFAAIACIVYLFFPSFGEAVAWGMAVLVGPALHFQGNGLELVGVFMGVVGGLALVAVTLLYWIVGVRNFVLAFALGLSINYVVISWLMVVFDVPLLAEAAAGLMLSYVVFFVAAWLVSKPRIHSVLAVVVSVLLVGVSFYAGSYITSRTITQKVDAEEDAQFAKVIKELNFTVYYPSYASALLPADPAKLNGYDKDLGDVQNVTFLLGRARVKQGALLSGQDKLLNFKDNCNMFVLWSAMDTDSSIDDFNIKHSLEYPTACNLVETTPSGKKVYFDDSDEQRQYFYVRVGNTNFMIEFEEIDRPYDPALKSEYLKVIDSLQSMDKAKLQKGAYSGFGFLY